MRLPFIAANWKMHKSRQDAAAFVEKFANLAERGNVETAICPAFPLLSAIGEACHRHGIRLGAQNMHWEEAGAYTGEVSPLMLKELAVDYVILGHSERRQLFAETDRQIARKVKTAFRHDLIPILCVGETLSQRQAGQAATVVSEQVAAALSGLDPSQVRRLIVAYEPVWAIGSGLAATAGDAGEMAALIRKIIGEMFSLKTARDVRIIYGGSVTEENCGDFIKEPEIDGALVGGASLDAARFAGIIKRTREVTE